MYIIVNMISKEQAHYVNIIFKEQAHYLQYYI